MVLWMLLIRRSFIRMYSWWAIRTCSPRRQISMRRSIHHLLVGPIVWFPWRKVGSKRRRAISSIHFPIFHLLLLIPVKGWIHIFAHSLLIDLHLCSMIKWISFFHSLSRFSSQLLLLLPIWFIRRRHLSHIVVLLSLILLEWTSLRRRYEFTHVIWLVHSALLCCGRRVHWRRHLVAHKSYQWWLLEILGVWRLFLAVVTKSLV